MDRQRLPGWAIAQCDRPTALLPHAQCKKALVALTLGPAQNQLRMCYQKCGHDLTHSDRPSSSAAGGFLHASRSKQVSLLELIYDGFLCPQSARKCAFRV